MGVIEDGATTSESALEMSMKNLSWFHACLTWMPAANSTSPTIIAIFFGGFDGWAVIATAVSCGPPISP